jgi:chromosome segregation ATPase
MIDQLTRNNEELKAQNQGLISEVELLREKYFVAKQNLEKALREGTQLKDELTKTLFAKDTLEKEFARVNAKLGETLAAKKIADDKVEFLNNKVNTTTADLRKSEANAAMLHERFTLVKAEKDALEIDSRNKIICELEAHLSGQQQGSHQQQLTVTSGPSYRVAGAQQSCDQGRLEGMTKPCGGENQGVGIGRQQGACNPAGVRIFCGVQLGWHKRLSLVLL